MGFVLNEIAVQSGTMLNRSGEISNLKRKRFQLAHTIKVLLTVTSQMTLNHIITSVLAPLSGELPKAEGATQAVYFAMNISRDPGDTHS